MYKLTNNEPLLHRLVNRQFQLIGQDVTIQELKNGVTLKEAGKTKIKEWWKVYQFDDEQQYMEWKTWAANEIEAYYDSIEEDELQLEINYLDLVYGMSYKIKKEELTA
jgi:hypothetical protein